MIASGQFPNQVEKSKDGVFELGIPQHSACSCQTLANECQGMGQPHSLDSWLAAVAMAGEGYDANELGKTTGHGEIAVTFVVYPPRFLRYPILWTAADAAEGKLDCLCALQAGVEPHPAGFHLAHNDVGAALEGEGSGWTLRRPPADAGPVPGMR